MGLRWLPAIVPAENLVRGKVQHGIKKHEGEIEQGVHDNTFHFPSIVRYTYPTWTMEHNTTRMSFFCFFSGHDAYHVSAEATVVVVVMVVERRCSMIISHFVQDNKQKYPQHVCIPVQPRRARIHTGDWF